MNKIVELKIEETKAVVGGNKASASAASMSAGMSVSPSVSLPPTTGSTGHVPSEPATLVRY
jgi:hypothetical protein